MAESDNRADRPACLETRHNSLFEKPTFRVPYPRNGAPVSMAVKDRRAPGSIARMRDGHQPAENALP